MPSPPPQPQPSQPPRTFLQTHIPSPSLPRLLIRTPLPTDAPAIRAILTNPANIALDPNANRAFNNALPTVEQIRERVEVWRAAAAEIVVGKEGRLNLLVVELAEPPSASSGDEEGRGREGKEKDEKGEGKVIGLTGYGHIAPSATTGRWSGNLGIMLNPEGRGKGYAAEAVRLCVRWGFKTVGFEEVSVGTLERNGAMVKVMGKALGWESVKRWVAPGGGGKLVPEGEEGEWELFYVMGKSEWEESERRKSSAEEGMSRGEGK